MKTAAWYTTKTAMLRSNGILWPNATCDNIPNCMPGMNQRVALMQAGRADLTHHSSLHCWTSCRENEDMLPVHRPTHSRLCHQTGCWCCWLLCLEAQGRFQERVQACSPAKLCQHAQDHPPRDPAGRALELEVVLTCFSDLTLDKQFGHSLYRPPQLMQSLTTRTVRNLQVCNGAGQSCPPCAT